MTTLKSMRCFKSYDIRGILGEEIDEEIVYAIGCATAQVLEAKTVVIGFDARAPSPSLAQASSTGIRNVGADVLNIGLAGTEQVYAAVSSFSADAGIQITASHNPINYNGMKIVKKQSQPLSVGEFSKIRSLAEAGGLIQVENAGRVIDKKKIAHKVFIEK